MTIPYAGVLHLTVESDANGPIFCMPFGPDVVGRPGFLHGGAISGLLEMAAAGALRHALALEGRWTTEGEIAVPRIKPVSLTIDFMRGGRDKTTRAQGIVTRLGTRVANIEAIAWQDERDRPIAAARMNYLIVRRD